MSTKASKQPGSGKAEPRKDKPREESGDQRESGERNYPPDSLRNPLPGLDPQQTPGSDRADL